MMLLVSLLIFFPKILTGFVIAHLIWQDTEVRTILLKLAVGVPLGLALAASLFFVAVLAGVSPRNYSWLELGVSLLIVVVFLAKRLVKRRQGKNKFTGFSWQDVIGISILLIGGVLSISAFLTYARMHPYGFEDAWSIWNLPARVIFRENSASILTNSQAYNRFHPDYPIALSLNVAWGWFIMMRETFRIPMAVSLLSTFTPAILLWAALSKWKGGLAGSLGALILMITPDLSSAVGQYADPLLALHMVAAAALFYGYLKSGENGLIILAGLLAGSSAWVKNEGLLFICVFFVVCLLAVGRQMATSSALKSFGIGLTVPLLIVILFKLIVETQNDIFGNTTSLYNQILDGSRWVLIVKSFISNFAGYAGWPVSIVLVLLVYAVLMGWDRAETRHQVLLFLLFTGQIVGYFFIYLITPHDLQRHINTSIERVLFHVFPLIILWLFVALRSPNLRPVAKAAGESQLSN